MGDEVIIAFYIAVPIVILAAAFVYYVYRRGEDIERADEASAAMPAEDEFTAAETPSTTASTGPTTHSHPT